MDNDKLKQLIKEEVEASLNELRLPGGWSVGQKTNPSISQTSKAFNRDKKTRADIAPELERRGFTHVDGEVWERDGIRYRVRLQDKGHRRTLSVRTLGPMDEASLNELFGMGGAPKQSLEEMDDLDVHSHIDNARIEKVLAHLNSRIYDHDMDGIADPQDFITGYQLALKDVAEELLDIIF
jgi:hypothetical protein